MRSVKAVSQTLFNYLEKYQSMSAHFIQL